MISFILLVIFSASIDITINQILIYNLLPLLEFRASFVHEPSP